MRKKLIHFLLFGGVHVLICMTVACTPDEELITSDQSATLSFSQDTVLFDTLFSTIGSTTQSFKVYNQNQNAVRITSVSLGRGNSSAYHVYINGEQSTQFTGVVLLGGDSLLVLVEVFINPQDEDLPFLVKDSLVFTTNQNKQDVKLISWGQDAYFIKGLLIRQDTTLSGKRPYVVYDSLWVGPNATLRLERGTRLYFNKGSSLIVNGSLQVAGSAEERVLFRNDRTDGAYENGAGQWQGIFFSRHSKENRVNFATIRNAQTGLLLEGNDSDTIPDLTVSNTIIENMSQSGITAFNADLDAYNLLVDNCVGYLVGNLGGGYYRYVHCTFANIFSGTGPALFFADTLSENISQPFRLSMKNNIIWGNRPDELFVVTQKESTAVEIDHNLIKTRNQSYAGQNLRNEDPQFVNPFVYDYQLDSTSVAIDQGKPTQVIKDLNGILRDTLPDLGAYEYIKE